MIYPFIPVIRCAKRMNSMTELLKTAVAEVSKRTVTQQNVIAS